VKLAAIICALCLGAAPAAAQAPAFDPQARVTEALEQVRPVAYHRDRLDWAAIEARARALAEGARDEVDLMPAYQALVSYLEDNHSQVEYPAGLMERWRERYGNRRMLPDPPPSPPRSTSRFMTRREPEVRATPLGSSSIGVIIVPSAQYEPLPSTFGARLHAGVRAVQDQVCGYVVDLRGNTGGALFPMVVGLSDLIGDDRRVVYVRPDGSEMVARLKDGALSALPEDGPEILLDRIEGWQAAPSVGARPVAVLMDDATGSSGEGAALALIGRDRVRTFGGRTAGVASANQEIALSDGTILLVTTAMMADQRGRTYPEGIPPDEPIASSEGENDAVQAAAEAWLTTQEGCSALRTSAG
jgi:carboxyl-terminal processing protease